jgi:hypothetical protein
MSETPKISALAKPSAKVTASIAETEFRTPEDYRNWLLDELRFAKAYWKHRVQPSINGRKLHDFEFEIAWGAYSRVKDTVDNARKWNAGEWPMGDNKCNGNDGKQFPIPEKEFPAREEFCEPVLLRVDTSMNAETLAMIASPMIGKKVPKVAPSKSVHIAHDLFIEAQDYLDTLRKPQKKWAASLLFARQITVSFDEIENSNLMGSGQLPLLPPEPKQRNKGQMKQTAIRAAVSRYYEKRADLFPKEREAVKKDCLQNNRIPLPDLCKLRRDRFKRLWLKQQKAGLGRQSKRGAQFKSKRPSSAASSLPTAGIPEN